MVRRLAVPVVVLAGTALLATGCVSASSNTGGRTPAAATESASSSPSKSGAGSRTSSPQPSESADELDLGDKKFSSGADGKRVRALQKRLKALNYDPGKVDGKFGPATLVAVWAFQKVNGIKPSGNINKKTRAAFEDPEQPKAQVPNGAADRVEILLKKQILVVYDKDGVELISHVSTGTGQSYCSEYTDEVTGETGTTCGVAVTPTGNYKASRRIDGWRKSKLGLLFNPVYFNGGIAVHGAPSVPLYPASHGCVRIPMHTAHTFPDIVDPDERVYVRK